MEENERIIREFIEAWARLDPKELAAGKIKVWRDYFDFATYQRWLA